MVPAAAWQRLSCADGSKVPGCRLDAGHRRRSQGCWLGLPAYSSSAEQRFSACGSALGQATTDHAQTPQALVVLGPGQRRSSAPSLKPRHACWVIPARSATERWDNSSSSGRDGTASASSNRRQAVHVRQPPQSGRPGPRFGKTDAPYRPIERLVLPPDPGETSPAPSAGHQDSPVTLLDFLTRLLDEVYCYR